MLNTADTLPTCLPVNASQLVMPLGQQDIVEVLELMKFIDETCLMMREVII